MPFSRMIDQDQIASARAALETAWSDIEGQEIALPFDERSCREWLAWIVVGLENAGHRVDVAGLAVRQFLATVCLLSGESAGDVLPADRPRLENLITAGAGRARHAAAVVHFPAPVQNLAS